MCDESVTKESIRECVRKTSTWEWKIEYQGAECWFEMSDDVVGIVSHLYVPKTQRNQGIGSSMLSVAVEMLSSYGAEEVHAQIRGSDGATDHILRSEGFDTTTFEKQDPQRTIVDGVKKL